MANFHHPTPPMENTCLLQRQLHTSLQKTPGRYHGSQSCPSTRYPALSESHYHPSQVPSSAQRSITEHVPLGGKNTGPSNPTDPAPTHNPIYPPGCNVPTGYSAPPWHGDPPQSVSWPCIINTLNRCEPQSPQMSSSHLLPPLYPPVDPSATPQSQTVYPPNPPSVYPVNRNHTRVGSQLGYISNHQISLISLGTVSPIPTTYYFYS